MPKLGKPPERDETAELGDFVELACLLEPGGIYDGTSLIEAFVEQDELAESPAAADDGAGSYSSTDAGDDDARFQAVVAVWDRLEARNQAFGDAYPFEVDVGARELTTAGSTDLRLTYACCLLASQLARMSKSEQAILTKAFERISRYAILALMPAQADVWVFGTAATAGPFVGGGLQARLHTMATRLGCQVLTDGQGLSPHNSGDGGLDVVGHTNMEGPADRRLVVFGQCACGDNWATKQSEVSLDTWSGRLSLRGALAPVTLIPRDFRDDQGDWKNRFVLSAGNVLVDRRRFLHLIARSPVGPFSDLPRTLLDGLPGLQEAA